MYHCRFKNTHYEAGFQWGQTLRKHGMFINEQPTFQITAEREEFVKGCIPIYEREYPEILEEIRGIAEGQEMSYQKLLTFLLSMYCFQFDNHCTCIAFKNENYTLLGRNSDFLVCLEKLYMNCLYNLDSSFAFNGNTTAFVQMEDGMNQFGLAVGLTFVYPKVRKYGFNAGMLVRYILEKCQTTKQAICFLKRIPIASQQTITLLDAKGDMAVVECNPYIVKVLEPRDQDHFIAATNNFHSKEMADYCNFEIDDWYSEKRYQVAYHALKIHQNELSLDTVRNILAGKYGFMCQYDRKKGADTVWSVIYDTKNKRIYRVEGNPSRKQFKEDIRLSL